ncbi:MAG: hypothetical protein QNJ40_12830 [Xanthomonadales bacterium]|nr:hypothetical protein [Xanthomonadales bacterium]
MSKVTNLPTAAELDDDQTIVEYVLDRLAPDARAEFELRLAESPELYEKVQAERALAEQIYGAIPVEQPGPEAFDRIRSRVNPARQLSRIWPIAAAIGICAVALTLVVPQFSTEPEFETLSTDEPGGAAAGPNVAILVFTADLSPDEIGAAIESLNLELLDGPGPGSAYTVKSSQPISNALLESWRQDPRIVLAERTGPNTSD